MLRSRRLIRALPTPLALACALAWTRAVVAQPEGEEPPSPPKGPGRHLQEARGTALDEEPEAEADSTAAAGPDAGRARARHHFRKGLKLFRDRNYAGALAEFEASYAAKPVASTLTNIALCHKALFRYSEAARALRQVLSAHAAELEEAERDEVEQAIDELDALVGRVRLTVTPPDARVTLGGRLLLESERSSLELDVGEHVFVAEAPGYARLRRVVRVAGGAPLQLSLDLEPTHGFVSVKAPDAESAIAIDGAAVAFQRWKGPVSPGRHYVQVYKDGYEPFEKVVYVELGKTTEVEAALGARVDDPRIDLGTPKPVRSRPRDEQQRGWYVLGTLSALSLDRSPAILDQQGAEVGGGSGGVRGGYRVWTPVALELMVDLAGNEVTGACSSSVAEGQEESGCDRNQERKYSLFSARAGANLRIFSGGRKLRFAGGAGFGVVGQRLQLEEGGANEPGGTASGTDPYFMVELGGQYNAGHVLVGVSVISYFSGTQNVRGTLDGSDGKVFEGNGLITAGVGLRIGWSQWSPD